MLMEATPDEVDRAEIQKAFSEVEGVTNVHDLHVWCLSQSKIALSVHMRYGNNADPNEILKKVDHIARSKFHINHLCIQTEKENTLCGNDLH